MDKIFEVDRESKVVTVHTTKGETLVLKKYTCLHSVRMVVEFVRELVIDHHKPEAVSCTGSALKKVHYEEFEATFGVYPATFRRIFNAIMVDLWVRPVEKYLSRYAFGKVYIKTTVRGLGQDSYTQAKVGMIPHIVTRVWENKERLDETERDGLKTIQPWVLALEKSPKELKEALGKGLWKELCRQSYTRNRAMARQLSGRSEKYWPYSIRLMLQMPSKYLVRGGNSPIPISDAGVVFCRLEREGQIPRLVNEASHYATRRSPPQYNTLADTVRMGRQLGENINMNWSWAKWQEKHDEFNEKIILRRFSKDQFKWVHQPWVIKKSEETVGDDRYAFTLLDNAYAIRKEGLAMHHCVASYASSSEKGDYMVYSCAKNGEQYSTLGLRVKDSSYRGLKITYDQHYKACNKLVEAEAEGAATSLQSKLNQAFQKHDVKEVLA